VVYVFPVLLLLLALLQATVVPALPFLEVRPDLVLLIILVWTMVRGLGEGAIGAFVGGIALDALSTFPLGSHALVLLLVILPLGWLAEPRYRGNLLLPIVGTFLATILYNVLLLTLSQILGLAPAWGPSLWRIVLPLALTEAILTPLVYWILDFIDRRGHRRVRPV
jgi:rod shape-determining protein MreD